MKTTRTLSSLLISLIALTGCANMGPKIASKQPVVAAVAVGVAVVMSKPTPCDKKAKEQRLECQAKRDKLTLAIANASKGN